jgi:hypothetical protein
MAFIFEDILKNTYIIKINEQNNKDNSSWEYPIIHKLSNPYLYQNAQSLLEFSYRVSLHNREVNEGIANPVKLDPPDFDIIIPLNTTILIEEVNVLWFFYSTKLNIAVITFTATYNDILVAVDLDYSQEIPTSLYNYIDGIKIHGGFWKLYQAIQSDLLTLLTKYVNKDTQVISTGISLGGATSTIGALDMYRRKLNSGVIIRDFIHYSFASPRVFNIVGSQYFDIHDIFSYRITNGSDIVPTVPFPIMPTSLDTSITEDFMHVSSLIYFDRNLGAYYDNHIKAYLCEYDVTPIS